MKRGFIFSACVPEYSGLFTTDAEASSPTLLYTASDAPPVRPTQATIAITIPTTAAVARAAATIIGAFTAHANGVIVHSPVVELHPVIEQSPVLLVLLHSRDLNEQSSKSTHIGVRQRSVEAGQVFLVAEHPVAAMHSQILHGFESSQSDLSGV